LTTRLLALGFEAGGAGHWTANGV